MKLPLSWLREFVDIAVEPERLGEDLTLAGFALDGIERDGADTILDLDVTTNRVDCMNVYGVAREVSVLYGTRLKPLALDVAEDGPPAAEALDVRIEASDLCPRFSARVLDVRIGPSPALIRERLERMGVRPVNNVVDLTNYVMLEMGHPSHAFDLARVPGGRLIARWGIPGETLVTLDGVSRTLPETPRVGVVACPERPLALAGVMGGQSSEVSDDTRLVALEAAYWDPQSVRRAVRALSLRTEASHRFERGADPEGTAKATARIAHLLREIGAGSARPGLIDRVGAARAERSVPLRRHRVSLVLGVSVPAERAQQILEGLGFAVAPRDGRLEVKVPSWRGDVSREVDLIEEIGRHHGLGRIPAKLPTGGGAVGLRPWQQRERLVRRTLLAAGFDEVINLSFLPEPARWQPPGAALRLLNPLAEDQASLRRSLVLPGLLTSLETNLRQGRRDMRLFELGRVFGPAEHLAAEERRLGLLATGSIGAHWSERPRAADFFDLKGLLAELFERLGAAPPELERETLPHFLHPGRAARVRHAGEVIGWVGALHPELLAELELRGDAYVAELAIDALLRETPRAERFRALPRFPAVERDLSVVCAGEVEAARLLAAVRDGGGGLLVSADVADRYEGAPIPPGKVSLMLALRFQDPQRTLTAERVDAVLGDIVAALRGAGAEIRGE